jgi:hypothetical protein
MKRRRWLRRLVLILLTGAGVSLGFVWWWLPGTHVVAQDAELPARWAAGLFYLEPVTVAGERMSLLADTGGGTFVTRRCAGRCGMRATPLMGGRSQLPTFQSDAWIPEPSGGEKWVALNDEEGDGMLGQRWFAGGVWTFDYPKKKLILRRAPFVPTSDLARHATPLGFRHEWGLRTSNHPRCVVTIDGQSVDALLDTGATVWPSPQALRALDDATPARGPPALSRPTCSTAGKRLTPSGA